MKALGLILSLLVSVLSIHAEEISLNAHVVDLPAEIVTLPPTMAGQLALVRETIEVAEMLQTVLETPDVYVNPQATVCLIAEKWLLPRWRALSELPVARLRELLLLVDAIDWQSAWVLDVAEADSCVSMPRDEDSGSTPKSVGTLLFESSAV